MKRVVSVLLSVLFLLTALPLGAISVAADTSGTVGDLYWSLDDGHLTISGSGAIPDYGEYIMFEQQMAPWYGYAIETVTIDYGVTRIGDYAFYDCDNLTSIDIADTVTSIGEEAFYGCSSLTSIVLPESLSSVEYYAFFNCDSLTTAYILGNITDMGFGMFCHCDKLTTVVLGEGLSTIGNRMFDDCTALTDIHIPAGVTSIGSQAFAGCSSLATVTVAEDNACYMAEDNVLFNKDKTTLMQYMPNKPETTYRIPDSITTIGGYAFYNCDALTAIEMPDGLISISDYAFYDCDGLVSVSIPYGVTSIGGDAFASCSSLTSIVIPDSVTIIDGYAFASCSSLTSVVLPAGLEHMGGATFSNCTALESVEIPYGVSDIEHNTFEGCTALSSVTIPDSVTTIGSYAFDDCDALTSVVIPDSVTSIDYCAFMNCDALCEVTVGASMSVLPEHIFSGDAALTTLTLPSTLTMVAPYALNDCAALTTIIYDGTAADAADIRVDLTGNDALYAATWHGTEGTFTLAEREIPTLNVGDSAAVDITYENEKVYFQFTPDTTGYYTFYSDGGNDPYGYIMDEDGNQLNYNHDIGSDWDFAVSYEMTAGTTYWLVASDYSVNSFTVYLSAGDWSNIDYTIEAGGSVSLYFEDYYQTKRILFIPEHSGDYTFHVDEAYEYIDATLTDAYGNVLDSSSYYHFSFTHYLSAGERYILTTGYSGMVAYRSYTVYLREEEYYPVGCSHYYDSDCDRYCNWCEEARDVTGHEYSTAQDDSCNKCGEYRQLKYIQPDMWERVNITISSETERFLFIPTYSGEYTFSSIDNSGDPYGYLYDLYGNELSRNDDGAGNQNFTITYYMEAGVTYELRAGCYSSGTGSYYVTLIAPARPPESYLTYEIINDEVVITDCDSAATGDMVIPDYIEGYPVATIGAYAFADCTNLTTIYIPATVTAIEDWAFRCTSSLYAIDVAEDNPVFTAEDGVLFNADKTVLLTYPCGKDLVTYAVPQRVTEIDSTAFFDCDYLETVTIADTVTCIGDSSFGWCDRLMQVHIPDSVTSIRMHAFIHCTALFSIALPENLEKIVDFTFYGCLSLTEVSIGRGTTIIGSSAFTNAPLTDVYYNGTGADRAAMTIATTENEPLLNACWHYLPGVFYVTDGEATVGDTVTVAVGVRDNPGIVSLKLAVSYDTDALELVEVTAADFEEGDLSFGPMESPFMVNWINALSGENNVQDGVVAYLTFRVKEGAPVGETPIYLSYNPNDVFAVDYTNRVFTIEPGAVEISEVPYGDLNGDGKINIRDLGVLQQYIQRYEVTINRAAADLNRDGKINIRDLGLLQQYLNGWDVEFG